MPLKIKPWCDNNVKCVDLQSQSDSTATNARRKFLLYENSFRVFDHPSVHVGSPGGHAGGPIR